jgi:hypothetical protein
MQAIIPICDGCTRFRESDDDHPTWWCAAFPGGIPWQIGEDGFDHRRPFEGDNGIRFDSVEGFDVNAWAAEFAGMAGHGEPPTPGVDA